MALNIQITVALRGEFNKIMELLLKLWLELEESNKR